MRYGGGCIPRHPAAGAGCTSLRLNGTVEQVHRVDARTTLVVDKLEEIRGGCVRALVNERVRVYRRDGSAKRRARDLEKNEVRRRTRR